MVKLSTKLSRKLSRKLSIDLAANAAVSSLFALTGFSASSFFQTQAGGGEAGVNTGFGSIELFRHASTSAAVRYLRSKLGTNAGWQHLLYPAIGANYGTGSAYPDAPRSTVTASDVGRIMCLVTYYDAASSRLHAWVNKQYLGFVSQAAYAPGTLAQFLGVQNAAGALPATGIEWLAGANFRHTTAPSAAQIEALFDAIRALGDIPKTMDGATITHRYSVRDQLIGVTNPAAGRQTYGIYGFAAPAYFATPTATPSAGFLGDANGFFIQYRARIEQTENGMYVVSRTNAATQGYIVDFFGTTISARFGNGSAFVTSPALALTSADVGRTVLVTYVFDKPNSLLRQYVDGVQVGAGTAMATYVPYVGNDKYWIGACVAGTSARNSLSLYQVAAGNAIPSAAALVTQAQQAELTGTLTLLPGTTIAHDFHADIVANGGTVPATSPDRVGSVTLNRTGTLQVITDTVSAVPFAPAQLTDTITQASVDALARVGSPRVVTVDPSIDGRVTKGVLGFGTAAIIETASATTGLRGGNTMWLAVPFIPWSNSAGVQCIAGTTENGGQGWQINTSGSQLSIGFRDGTSNKYVSSASGVIAAGDVGQPQLLVLSYDGAKIDVFYKRQIVVTFAASGYQNWAKPMRIGNRADGGAALANSGVFALQGADGQFLTFAEVTALYDQWERDGRLTQHAKGAHWWDFTLDIAANGGELPAVFLDRIGTDHLENTGAVGVTRTGGRGTRLAKRSPGSAATPTAVAYYRTAVGGGVRFTAAGAHFAAKLTIDGQASDQQANKNLVSTVTTSPSAQGWTLFINAQNTQIGLVTYLAGVSTVSATYTVPAGKVGVPLVVELVHTGSALQLFVDGAQVGIDVAAGATSDPGTPMMIGCGDARLIAINSIEDVTLHMISGGATVPTPAEIAARAAASIGTNALARVPGKTQKEWDLRAPTSTVRGSVVEAVGGADVDRLTLVGAGLQVAQRVERLYSYETSPIVQGAQTFSATDFYETPNGLAGNIGGFWGAVLLIVRSQSVPSTGRVLLSRRSTGNSGWNAASNATNSTISAVLSTTTSTYATPALSVAVADVGKLILFGWSMDVQASKLRGYGKRAEVAGGTTIAGTYIPLASGTMQLGRRNADVVAADAGVEIYGFTVGNGVPTLAQFQALHDACMANEDIVEMPGMSSLTISLKQDAKANGGALPAVLLDRTGNQNFVRNGSPVLASQFARAWSW